MKEKVLRDTRIRKTSGLQDNFFGDQFSTFDSPRDHPQGINSFWRISKVPKKLQGQGLLSQEKTNKIKANICRKAVDYEFV